MFGIIATDIKIIDMFIALMKNSKNCKGNILVCPHLKYYHLLKCGMTHINKLNYAF